MQGEYRESIGNLREALRVLQASGLTAQPFVESLYWLGAVELAEERPVRAARLFGAAEGQSQVIGWCLSPPERQAYERDLVTLRAQLDDKTLAAEFDEGRAMTRDRILHYALENVPDA